MLWSSWSSKNGVGTGSQWGSGNAMADKFDRSEESCQGPKIYLGVTRGYINQALNKSAHEKLTSKRKTACLQIQSRRTLNQLVEVLTAHCCLRRNLRATRNRRDPYMSRIRLRRFQVEAVGSGEQAGLYLEGVPPTNIEREKADLSVQVIQLSERLEEAEGGAESQFEINKKRDTELLKLRKLLEDVHLESEETASILKRKHQEIVVDFRGTDRLTCQS
ncbi:hypothetical protein NQ317_011437 [Molorchus minor]|uniref:Uncharacterized protein n=1 Tax=Molorchus minor TaxID=1323400 RepID=A0ABQ9IZU6_9CUCU|nr:hypothetical protein NQ317_011437 [Molorchus minor]